MNKTYVLLFLIFSCILSTTGQEPIYLAESIHHPQIAEQGMVATQHHAASKVGLEILKQGGNAIDAAVAIGFSLAVVLPRAGNLGGGGFMLVHNSEDKKTHAINYREIAPKQSGRDMYLDKDGNVDNKKFNSSYHSIGVPGTVAGLCHALEQYGTMSIDQVVAPAIKLAREGFEISHDLAGVLDTYQKRLRACPETEKIFYKEDGSIYNAGDILIQKDLAWSLEQIAKHGAKSFYEGELAKRLATDIRSNGGIMHTDDLKAYKAEEVDVVKGSYRGYDIYSMPPPSSGGVHIIQMLNILEEYPLDFLGHNSAETIHLMVEAMRVAYADRSEHLGDPNYWDVPVKWICSKEYAKDLRKKISTFNANDSKDIKPGTPKDYESEETTHFSVVDKYGNAVSNTYTLNFSFGTGLVAKGTGILLNNEMGDFSAKPGTANAFGLIGGAANAVEAGKRPLSSMTPTMVFKDNSPFLITGSPGGSRIITTVLQIILNVIDHNMNVAEATHATRIHHQWYPDILYSEKVLNTDTKRLLAAKGHIVKTRAAMGSTQTLMLKDGFIFGASDPRRPDASTLGF